MTIKQLKELIKDLPDNTRIVRPASDHSYEEARARVGSAMLDRSSGWTEDFGEKVTPETKDCFRRRVVIVV